MTQPGIAVIGGGDLSGTILLRAQRDARVDAHALVHDDAGAERATTAGAHEAAPSDRRSPHFITK